MYYLITDDGTVYCSGIIKDDEKEAVDNGYLSIIDSETGKEYYNGKWEEVKKWNCD